PLRQLCCLNFWPRVERGKAAAKRRRSSPGVSAGCVYVAHAQVLLDAFETPLAPEARLLNAAEGGLGRSDRVRVQADDPDIEAARDPVGLEQVGTVDVAGQADLKGISLLDRVVKVVVG